MTKSVAFTKAPRLCVSGGKGGGSVIICVCVCVCVCARVCCTYGGIARVIISH